MKQYIYVPLQYEQIVADAVTIWISAPNYGWTIIVGVYQEGKTNRTGNSIVVNVLRQNREIINIPYTTTIQRDKTQISYELNGFTLEGDLDLFAPDFKQQLLQLSGVRMFDTNTEYLEWLQSI